MAKESVEGLHLWNVDVHYETKTGFGPNDRFYHKAGLWITTRPKLMLIALRKANAFLKHHNDKYQNAHIEGISHSGVLDV